MSTKKSSAGDRLTLVKLKGQYFPLSEADYKLLCDKHVAVFRISEENLTLLSSILLKGVRIEQRLFRDVYPELLNAFIEGLNASSDEEGAYDFKHEANWILVRTETPDEETGESRLNAMHKFSNMLVEYMGRYGLRTKQESKTREKYVLTRLEFIPDPDIVPSFYFGNKEDYNTPLRMVFNMGKSARLVFNKRQNIGGEATMAITFEDRFGDHWQEAFTRAFPMSLLAEKDCTTAIEFFVELHGRVGAGTALKHK